MDPLSEVLKNENGLGLMKEFGSKHSVISNFKMWLAFMNMVDILLDFIRGERDSN